MLTRIVSRSLMRRRRRKVLSLVAVSLGIAVATAVGTDSMKAVPVIGDWLVQVMRGGRRIAPAEPINTLRGREAHG